MQQLQVVEDTKPLRGHSNKPPPAPPAKNLPSKTPSLFAGIKIARTISNDGSQVPSKTPSLFVGIATSSGSGRIPSAVRRRNKASSWA